MRKSDKLGAFLGAVGLIGCILVAYPMAREYDDIPLTQKIGCRECHSDTVPYIKSCADYNRYHRKPNKADLQHKAEVKRNTEILMEVMR